MPDRRIGVPLSYLGWLRASAAPPDMALQGISQAAGGLWHVGSCDTHQDRRQNVLRHKIDRQVLTVTTNYGKKTAQLDPKVSRAALADQLLHELVREEKGRKGSLL